MEALLKVAALAAIVLLSGLGLAACATIDKAVIGEAIASPKADQAAVAVERVVAVLADSFSGFALDPKAEVDRVKLARQVDGATQVLARARQAFDARQGGVSALVGEAFNLVAAAIPDNASTGARVAISTAFAGLRVYAMTLDGVSLPAPPSAALIAARARTDDAIAALRAKLPPPGS